MSPTTARVLALHLHDAEPRSAIATVREPRIVPPAPPFRRDPWWKIGLGVCAMGLLGFVLIYGELAL